VYNGSGMNTIFKRSKILATLGPATNNQETIEAMILAGVNGIRLNFSHGDHESHQELLEMTRKASVQVGKPVAIIQDLQGPKVRLGDFDGIVNVHKDQELTLVYKGEYDGGSTLPVQYDLSAKVKPGERVYLYDGKVRSTVISVESPAIKIRVENDGILLKRKGINLPDTDFGGDILTEKDMRDIDFGIDKDFDYVALSFVQRASDVVKLREILDERGSNAKIIVKVETRSAIEDENLEEIIKVTDVVMVARGDLAFETSPEIVPIVQRRILQLAKQHGKISIVATQVLLSMVDSPEPTRAEVSDIANAVIQGADCLMLSEETAMGQYPLEVIKTMKRVILYTQEHEPVSPVFYRQENHSQQDSVSSAAVTLAHQVGAKVIIAETKTGNCARSIASHRPGMAIISVTSVPRTAQQLAILYANKSFVRPDGEHAGFELAKELKEQGYFGDDEKVTVVIVSGRQPGLTGATDTIRVRVLE
jgi:pyruvate kinase